MAITAVISPEDLSWDDFDVTPDRIVDPADGTLVDAFTRFNFDFPDLAPRKIGNEFALADPNVITISPNAQVFADVLQTDELLSHVAPVKWDHIALTGDYLWSEIERPRERFRPLRTNRLDAASFRLA